MKQITDNIKIERWIGSKGVAIITMIDDRVIVNVYRHSRCSNYRPAQLNFPCTVEMDRKYNYIQSARRWIANNL